MIPSADLTEAEAVGRDICTVAAGLSREIVDVAGFLDAVDARAREQSTILADVSTQADRIADANAAVQETATGAAEAAASILAATDASIMALRASGARTRSVAEWVENLDARMNAIESTLAEVTRNTQAILGIARQVNILAINAKIEAARAGDAGKGFSVVAEAINDLSRKTSLAAETITGSIDALGGTLTELRSEAAGVADEAASVRREAEAADAAMADISRGLASLSDNARAITERSRHVAEAGSSFGPAIGRMRTVLERNVADVADARTRVNGLIDISEDLVQRSLSVGGSDQERRFVALVQQAAAEIGSLFEQALVSGRCTIEDLFDTDYRPVPRSNPQQHVTAFTQLTDQLLPAVQERMLTIDPKVVFCAAVDRNGYLPTHNYKFSRPQGNDPTWNAAHCRNRRIFNDRVGLKAGRNTKPFLLQVYRRDMGGGQFVLMRDLSAPITVRRRHWGGLRLALAF